MPSHFGNWMREEKTKVKAHNKALDDLVASGKLTHTVNYQLKESIMKGCKEPMKKKMPPKKKK